MTLRPIDIARKLNISTSSLRHYEAMGMVPAVERGANGYRKYTDTHLAYFECILAMRSGFGFEFTETAVKKIQRQEIEEVFWMVSEAQRLLLKDKQMAEKMIAIVSAKEWNQVEKPGAKKTMTIGEIAAETSVSSSAIRHWEMEGLITPERDPENGYRIFRSYHVRQILLIRTLKISIWSLDEIRSIMDKIAANNMEQMQKIATDSLKYIHEKNKAQMRGIYYLYKLCKGV